jgi:hypothetical protein
MRSFHLEALHQRDHFPAKTWMNKLREQWLDAIRGEKGQTVISAASCTSTQWSVTEITKWPTRSFTKKCYAVTILLNFCVYPRFVNAGTQVINTHTHTHTQAYAFINWTTNMNIPIYGCTKVMKTYFRSEVKKRSWTFLKVHAEESDFSKTFVVLISKFIWRQNKLYRLSSDFWQNQKGLPPIFDKFLIHNFPRFRFPMYFIRKYKYVINFMQKWL